VGLERRMNGNIKDGAVVGKNGTARCVLISMFNMQPQFEEPD
jgi:hypothetical protein